VGVTRLLSWAVRRLPPSRAVYGQALLAELPALPHRERRRWLLGAARFVVGELIVGFGGYLVAVAVAVVALVGVDRSSSDIANQVSLLVLLLAAAGLGFGRPRTAWFSGIVVGSCLAVAHGIYQASGSSLPYPMHPPGWVGAASLLVLLVPAVGAAYVGAAVSRVLERR
jgi:hypothetical protein